MTNMFLLNLFCLIIIRVYGDGYSNKHVLSSIMTQLLYRGGSSEGNLSSILTIVEELINHTTQAQNSMQSNLEAAKLKKNDTEGIYNTSKTNRLLACSVLNSSDFQRNFNKAKIMEDDANEILKETYKDYQDALHAHEKQNVEFEIESLNWIKNMVYRLLTGTHMPTTSPTRAPTPPPTLSPTTPALSNMFVRNHQRLHFGDRGWRGRRHVAWIDKEDNIICLGSCGVDQHPSYILKNGTLLPFSWIKDGAFKVQPLFLTDPISDDSAEMWEKAYAMWGQIDVSSPDELKGRKPISLIFLTGGQYSLAVLFDDGSIWMKPSQLTSTEMIRSNWNFDKFPKDLSNFSDSYITPKRYDTEYATKLIDARSITKSSGARRMFPYQSVSAWLKMSDNVNFSRIMSSNGNVWTLFAWDDAQDFWLYFGLRMSPNFFQNLFSSCDVEDPLDMIMELWNARDPLMKFLKFPRECYVGKGNIVDIFSQGRGFMFVLYDGEGGNGNLWGLNAEPLHQNFMSKNDPQYTTYPETKRGKKTWYQFGQNRRVTKFALVQPGFIDDTCLFIATTDGVYCIGRNLYHLCSPEHKEGKYLNWTKVNTTALTAPITRMFPHGRGMAFFLKDGSIFVLEVHTDERQQRYTVMTEYFKEITRTNEIVEFFGFWNGDPLYNDTIQEVILVNRSGSHYHMGVGAMTCDFSRDSIEQLTLCDGVADDLGYIDESVLYLS